MWKGTTCLRLNLNIYYKFERSRPFTGLKGTCRSRDRFCCGKWWKIVSYQFTVCLRDLCCWRKLIFIRPFAWFTVSLSLTGNTCSSHMNFTTCQIDSPLSSPPSSFGQCLSILSWYFKKPPEFLWNLKEPLFSSGSCELERFAEFGFRAI